MACRALRGEASKVLGHHLRRALEHMRANSEGVWWPLPRDIARYYRTLPGSVQLSAG